MDNIHTSQRTYTVTFIKPVKEIGGYDTTLFEAGESHNLTAEQYATIRKGGKFERHGIVGGHGYFYGYEFDKSYVANDATWSEVTTSVTFGVAKLGKQNKKLTTKN